MQRFTHFFTRFALSAPTGLLLLCGSVAVTQASRGATLELLGGGWVQETVTYRISASRNVDPAALSAVLGAIEDWNDKLATIEGAPLLVEFTGHGQADVTIQLKGGGGPTLGQTSLRPVSRFSCAIGSARVLLSGKAFGQEFSAAGVGNVTRHELGHVLGLGHSDDPGDLMYFAADAADIFGDESVPISDCDLMGINAIYPLPEDCSLPAELGCGPI
jgi:predicted Zn-dependent protease